jgi:hypothetical protein
MPRLLATPCAVHTCPNLRPCAEHQRQAEQARGTRQQRGYDRRHERLRATWQPMVEAGLVDCHALTCLMTERRIPIGAAWDLGHTRDRKTWTGPEHERCNRAEGGRAAHDAGAQRHHGG